MQSEDSSLLQAHECSEGLSLFAFGSCSNSGQLRTGCAHSRHQGALADPAAPTQTHQLLHNNCCSLVMPQTEHHLLQEHWKCPAPTASKCSRNVRRRLSHLIWVACNINITQGHCLGGRAAHCSPRDHQQDVPVDNFAIQEVQRAQLLLGVPTRSQRAPSPLLHTGCRAKPPSEQGN